MKARLHAKLNEVQRWPPARMLVYTCLLYCSLSVLFFCVQGPFYGKSTKNNVDNANSASYVGVFEANSLIRENNY